jgi:hypothetical protein
MSDIKGQAQPPRLASKLRYAAPPESLRYRAARVMEARTWQVRVMAAVGTWWFSEPDGVPSARTLRYGTVYERGVKSKPKRFATFGDAPEPQPDQEIDVRIITSNNDGFELWFGTPHEWHFHMRSEDVRLLFRYLVWEWFVRSRWFGMRRWIYYRALHSYVSRFRGKIEA